MKISWAFITLAGLSATTLLAQDTPYAVVERGPNHRVWQKTTCETTPDGRQIPHVHQYTELATGLHYQKDGQWVESKEQIDILPDGTAAATQGQHQACFPGNIYQGVIELVTPDGKHLKSRPLGLSYDDGNKTVLIAELTNSVGQLVGSNQVVYPNAFEGAAASLRYTYKKSGFDQDVLIQGQLPTPESYGLNPETTKLSVLTEFFDTNNPVVAPSPINSQDGQGDNTLTFGRITMIRGRAFSIGGVNQTNSPLRGTPTYKHWLQLSGRKFLVEEVPYSRVAPQLEQLSAAANVQAANTRTVSASSILHKVSARRLLPPYRTAQGSAGRVQLAEADTSRQRGLVLDYVTINSGETNFTFQGDATYYVSGEYYLYGTTVLEGGTVIKMDANGQLFVDENGTINCNSGSYHPAIFTSVNDNSVGEQFGSGSPAFEDVSFPLNINGTNATIHDCRFSYCIAGVYLTYGSVDVWNCQFQNVDCAVYAGNIGLHNVLIGRSVIADPAVYVYLSKLAAENVTADGGDVFVENDGNNVTLALTNCLITSQSLITGNSVTLITNSTVWMPSPTSPVYQTVGAGSYYLATNSPCRNTGTTNVNPTLLADLRKKTTYSPIVYSNKTFSVVTNFSPQTPRDTNATLDLGYHYDPIDYFFGGVQANSNMTFAAGTAVGWFYNWSSTGYGIAVGDSATVAFNGIVTAPCVFARYNTVQEGGNGYWTSQGYMAGVIGQSYVHAAPTVAAQFTHCYMLPNEGCVFRDNWGLFNQRATHSEFWSACPGGYCSSLNCTNCLFVNSAPGLWYNYNAANMTLWNCSLIRGNFTADHTLGTSWPVTIVNCAFDGTTIYMNGHGLNTNGAYCDYNAFLTNGDRLAFLGAHDVLTTNFNWQSGWLGNYYLPANSPLVNKGNTNASLLGLYHFTTQTNQEKEENSPVDIGYHYLAADANGNLLDSDGDGIPDYLEDANGNGQVDPGETDWMNSDSDYDGVNDGREIIDATDPLDPDSVLPVRLGYWRFDDTNTWAGDAGQLPLLAANVVGVRSWNTNAALIDGTNSAILRYRDVETNGNANINLRRGTIRFWFKPDWASTDRGGAGPQNMGRLIEMGDFHAEFTNGWWALYLNPDGTQLTFGSSTNGAGNTNLSAAVSWAYKRWHQIALTYSPTNAILYCDGQSIATNETTSNYYPGPAERTNGFRIGSDANGNNQAGGTFENLETFNYQLTAAEITNDFAAVSLPAPPPVAMITSPTTGGTYLVGTNLPLTITVYVPSEESIQQVDYSYTLSSGGNTCLNNLSAVMVDPPIGTATQPPFSFAWTNADWTNNFAGYYSITAYAVDETGVASNPNTKQGVEIKTDSDNDGIPDEWMTNFFGHATGEAGDNSLAGDDADGDGFSNLQEYQNGTDPTDFYNGESPDLEILSGKDQAGNYDSFLPLPLVVRITGVDSVSNAPITFIVTNGTALLATNPSGPLVSALSLRTDSNGLASVWVYFPPAGSSLPCCAIQASTDRGIYYDAVVTNLNEYVALARWHFNDTNTWVGEAGQLPLLTNNLAGVYSWSSNAVLIDSAGPARLSYQVVETNGSVNLNCQTGSVMFYFKPDWSSADGNQGGTGPGTGGRLIEIGRYDPAFTNGWWSLYLNADGTQLSFGTSTNGGGMVNLTATISWASNEWYQIALAYSSSGSALFVDGALQATGDGVAYFPNADELTNGFRIGSDPDGDNQARGAFDELETFACPLNGGIAPAKTYWTSIPDYQADPDGTLGAWQLANFGYIGLDPCGDFDGDGTNNLQAFLTGADPNKISFSFSVPNQYVNTNLVDGVITILGGVPSSIAILVDTNNFTEANWTPYTSSNITADIGTTPGPHDVWIGLRGRLTTSCQTWQETTLILNSNLPAITITSPADNASFNASRVNVSGNFTAATLKQITVNSTLAFINGTNFEARNVPLAGGANGITAVIEDLTGTTNAVSITVTGTTNADGSLNDPVQLVATPVAGFEPLTVTFQITSNGTPGTLQQVLWDFNGDGLTDFTTNSLGSVNYTYETNGQYFPVVTLQTSTGRFSSIGGWNAVTLDTNDQPIRINVQMPPTQATLASVQNPVDLKWDGTHLYVLSGSGAAVYEFATNGSTIRSLGGLGSNPSGLDVDGSGNVYVAVTGSHQVWKFNPTDISFAADTNFGIGGCIGLTNGASGSNTNEFNAPYDVAVSPDGGTISVSDSGNHRIQQFSAANGGFITSFGSSGSDVGQFNTPKGLTYDAYGTLYIVDSGNNRLELAQGSAVMEVTGSGGNGLGQFSGALNVSVGKRGVYVADTGNNRIQKFDLPAQGVFEITSGNVGYAPSTNLSSPAAVAAVDNLTNELFYVADTGNNRVILCNLPDSNAAEIQAVWSGMTTCVANGDISGAAQYFSSETADAYQQAFLAMGTATSISIIGQIGTLYPDSIDDNVAQYYFEQTIAGLNLTFPVEFVKEDDGWRILEF